MNPNPSGAVETPAGPGWWRRNRWGVLALIPVLLLALGLASEDVWGVYWKQQPREPVTPGLDGWLSYGGGRVRLVSLEQADDLKTYSGEPFTPPLGVRAWKATVSFEASMEATIGACDLSIEDSAGNLYEANPAELNGARSGGFANCRPEDDPAPLAYTNAIYFAAPVPAQVTALRIVVGTELPRYVRFNASS